MLRSPIIAIMLFYVSLLMRFKGKFFRLNFFLRKTFTYEILRRPPIFTFKLIRMTSRFFVEFLKVEKCTKLAHLGFLSARLLFLSYLSHLARYLFTTFSPQKIRYQKRKLTAQKSVLTTYSKYKHSTIFEFVAQDM